MAWGYRQQPWLHCCYNCKHLGIDTSQREDDTCDHPKTMREVKRDYDRIVSRFGVCNRFELDPEVK
jgi:hypothetical protein